MPLLLFPVLCENPSSSSNSFANEHHSFGQAKSKATQKRAKRQLCQSTLGEAKDCTFDLQLFNNFKHFTKKK
jgi:hypothetical protein